MNYGVKIKLSHPKYNIIFPKVDVIGKDASENIISSDDWTLFTLSSHETQYAASHAWNGVKTTTVESFVSDNSSNWY